MASHLFLGDALALAIGCVVLTIYLRRSSRRLQRGPLPPGPPPLPLLGNILDIPKKISAQEYQKLSDKYGECLYVSMIMGSYNKPLTRRCGLPQRSRTVNDCPRLVRSCARSSRWSFIELLQSPSVHHEKPVSITTMSLFIYSRLNRSAVSEAIGLSSSINTTRYGAGGEGSSINTLAPMLLASTSTLKRRQRGASSRTSYTLPTRSLHMRVCEYDIEP